MIPGLGVVVVVVVIVKRSVKRVLGVRRNGR
jgi:hypothetical protein